jgi:hypothetical protein
MLAGAGLTKYQSIYLLVPAVLAIVYAVVRELWRHWRARASEARSLVRTLAGPGALALTAVIATTPHWLANVVWYGNPVYPMLRDFFPSRPLVPGWPGMYLDHQFELTGTFTEKVREAAGATFSFAFVPHDWGGFHGDLPVFGFLFTLTLPVLLLDRRAKTTRALAAGTLLGVFIWYWTYHEDRYLQSLLPWMVASTAVASLLAWNAGIAGRIAIVLLVAVQLVWGNDVPWLPTHAMLREVPAMRSLRVLSSTYRGETSARLKFDTGFEGLDHMLPRDAYVLLHEEYLRLGLNRRAIQDSLRLQAGIDYRQLARPDRVHDHLKSLGATHLVWGGGSPNREVPLSGELVFWGYALRYGEGRTSAGGFGVAKLPAQRPPPREPGLVAYVGCNVARVVPLSAVDQVAAGDGNVGSIAADPAAAVGSAEFLVVESNCQSKLKPEVMAPFIEAPHWGELTPWVRRL